MENNTLITDELEQLRSQICILKEKLDKQTIINDEHIRRSMKVKMSDINKTVTATIGLGIFALIYCTWFFYRQGCSLGFVIITAVILGTCLGLTIIQRINLGRMDFSKGNLVKTAHDLSKTSKHYQNWHKIALPIIVGWLVWLIYEMNGILGPGTPLATGFITGAVVGGILGGIAGFRINRKIVRKANEILDQIEELQRGS